jgi:hypothetical protein
MTAMDAKAAFDAFKAAKADASKTNGEIVTQHNKLYEKQRLAKLAGDAAELAAENAKLKAQIAQLEGKGKATGRAA